MEQLLLLPAAHSLPAFPSPHLLCLLPPQELLGLPHGSPDTVIIASDEQEAR